MLAVDLCDPSSRTIDGFAYGNRLGIAACGFRNAMVSRPGQPPIGSQLLGMTGSVESDGSTVNKTAGERLPGGVVGAILSTHHALSVDVGDELEAHLGGAHATAVGCLLASFPSIGTLCLSRQLVRF